MKNEKLKINEAQREERLAVVENIRRAVTEGDSFRQVELHDPVVTVEMIKKRIIPFDLERKSPINKLRSAVAVAIAKKISAKVNAQTEIVGIENYLKVEGAAFVTCNHFSPTDSTHLRYLMTKLKDKSRLDIIVQEKNVFMSGFFGFLMNNCNTLPVSRSMAYMSGSLKPSLERLLKRGDKILIYPEQEMWFNYRRPREERVGVYHYATTFGVPVIPCFTEMRECEKVLENGFRELKYVFHILPPVYPDSTLLFRESRDKMQTEAYNSKVKCYEEVYGRSIDAPFDVRLDIAGYPIAEDQI